MNEAKELIEQHRELVKRREELIAMRASLHADLIDIDVRLERLHRKITAALAKLEHEHIDIDELPKW